MNVLQNLKDFEQNLMVPMEIANYMILQMPFQYCIIMVS